MSKPKKKPFRIFNSWQSDLPDQVNAHLIRAVLGEVTTALTEDDDIDVRAKMPGQKQLVRENEIEGLADRVAQEIASHASEELALRDKPKNS